MEEHGGGATLIFLEAIALLAAAVVAVPLFKRLGLGSVLGYIAAGVVIGPHALGVFEDAEAIMHVAELGVVLLLFVIGLELNLSRLWSMKLDIFGLGSAQIVVVGLLLTLYPLFVVGEPWQASLIAGLGLALSSTAFVMQYLEEKGTMNVAYGRKSFAILLMQDLALVPLLALVAFLSPRPEEGGAPLWLQAVEIVGAIALVIVAGRYLLTPLFRRLSKHGGREIMTAAALLVVIGSATLMTLVGLSMALGAFLAGVLLAESSYRHQLEADVEPFRGLLLGLFFLSVGMSVDLGVIAANWLGLLGGLLALLAIKILAVYAIARAFRNDHRVSLKTSFLLSQGGEFGFVLFTAAVSAGVMDQDHATLLVALVTLSMVTTPFLMQAVPYVLKPVGQPTPDQDYSDANGDVMIIGFGRFGQLVAQVMLADGHEITVLDADPNRISEAKSFGAEIYYGDGRRIDVLRAAGVDHVGMVLVCTDQRAVTDKIVEVLKEACPDKPLAVRAYDRRHAISLINKRVDVEVRETRESALLLGRLALQKLGSSADEALAVEERIRHLDEQRLEEQLGGGILAGRDKVYVRPEPLVPTLDHVDDAPSPESVIAPRKKPKAAAGDGGKAERAKEEAVV